nr:unnamed protein product [Digitaria exilis]
MDDECLHQLAHWKPCGTFLPQTLSSTGRFSLTTPSTLARSAVHRHTAASRSASPPRSWQHGCADDDAEPACWPSSRLSSPPSTLAHAPSFSAFTGHLPPLGALGVGGHGAGEGGGLGHGE